MSYRVTITERYGDHQILYWQIDYITSDLMKIRLDAPILLKDGDTLTIEYLHEGSAVYGHPANNKARPPCDGCGPNPV